MANRFCRMWVSKHGFKGKAAKNLRLIVEYIVGCATPLGLTTKSGTVGCKDHRSVWRSSTSF